MKTKIILIALALALILLLIYIFGIRAVSKPHEADDTLQVGPVPNHTQLPESPEGKG